MKNSKPTQKVEKTFMSNGLPSFEGVIKIEVSVNEIYQNLLDHLQVDLAHKESLAHAIVGTAEANETLHYLHNAMNGHLPKLDFKVGDTVIYDEGYRYVWYDNSSENEDGTYKDRPIPVDNVVQDYDTPNWVRGRREIGSAKIVDMRMYHATKLCIEYQEAQYSSKGDYSTQTMWVNHLDCAKIDTSVH